MSTSETTLGGEGTVDEEGESRSGTLLSERTRLWLLQFLLVEGVLLGFAVLADVVLGASVTGGLLAAAAALFAAIAVLGALAYAVYRVVA